MPARLLATKLAERWLGPLPSFGGGTAWSAEQGNLLEQEALPFFTFEYGIRIERPGFITDDAGKCGCSPDGLIHDGTIGLEVKCLQPVHHCACVVNGTLPKDFFAQIHFSMHVTGFSEWKLFLYHRSLPKMLLTIPRDEEIQDTIAEAIELFHAKLDAGWSKLLELNGGIEPPKREPMTFAHEFRSEMAS
jgi:hypothetical protein